MTAPVDLVPVLEKKPHLCSRIRRVHLMGGWMQIDKPKEDPDGKQIKEWSPPTIWENYNLNMAPEASKTLFQWANEGRFQMRLYSYRHVRALFKGSINSGNCEEIINVIKESKSKGEFN